MIHGSGCEDKLLTLKNSLNGVSMWASGLGTESHICKQEKY